MWMIWGYACSIAMIPGKLELKWHVFLIIMVRKLGVELLSTS